MCLLTNLLKTGGRLSLPICIGLVLLPTFSGSSLSRWVGWSLVALEIWEVVSVLCLPARCVLGGYPKNSDDGPNTSESS
jgi:hypothetical protein